MTFAILLYIAIGLGFAFEAGVTAKEVGGRMPWYADFTGFCIVTLFWGPIVAAVMLRYLWTGEQ